MPATAPTSRADRLELLARLLRDRPGVTAGELAALLGVSERSVFRDLDALRERGYPIESSRGRGGGLRLHANWGLGRVLLSREEALCTLLALAIAERVGFPMFRADVGRARRRVADAFPAAERKRLAPLRERIFVGPPASPSVRASYRDPAGGVLQSLQAAFVDERVVRATYEREDGVATERLLEPHALLINWPAWYLLAHDRTRDGLRTFRLDRFRQVIREDTGFRARPRDVIAAALGGSGVAAERV